MSATMQVSIAKNIAGSLIYFSLGDGPVEERTNREAGYYSDFGSNVFTAITAAENLMARHARKRVGMVGHVSFDPKQFDVKNSDDVAFAMEHTVSVLKTAHPGAPVHAVAHADAKGGHLHVHFFVANHDFQTGKSLRGAWIQPEWAPVNDQLLQESGYEPVKRRERAASFHEEKAKKRGKRLPVPGRDGDDVPLTRRNYKQYISDRLDEVLASPRVRDTDSFITVARDHDVDVQVKETRKGKRFTYAVDSERDDDGKPKFKSTQSRLGTAYEFDTVTEHLQRTAARLAREKAEREEQAAKAARLRRAPVSITQNHAQDAPRLSAGLAAIVGNSRAELAAHAASLGIELDDDGRPVTPKRDTNTVQPAPQPERDTKRDTNTVQPAPQPERDTKRDNNTVQQPKREPKTSPRVTLDELIKSEVAAQTAQTPRPFTVQRSAASQRLARHKARIQHQQRENDDGFSL